MDIRTLLSELIKEFATYFVKCFVENPNIVEKSFNSNEERLEFLNHCNFWNKDIFKALEKHNFLIHPLSITMLSNWLLRYSHALCEYTLLSRPTIKIVHRLPQFPPKQCYLKSLPREVTAKNNLHFSRGFHNGVHPCQLTAENIVEVFDPLLDMEDVETLHTFVPLIQCNVDLMEYDLVNHYSVKLSEESISKIKFIITLDLDEVVVVEKSLQGRFSLCDILIPTQQEIRKLPTGTVIKFSATRITFKLNSPIEDLISVDLVFRPTRVPIRYQHRALMLLDSEAYKGMRKYLFPQNHTDENLLVNSVNLELVNTEITNDPDQLGTVRNIALNSCFYAPFIIVGPPGTGKTTTIVESILQLRLQNAKSRILVTAGSNAACDTIAIRLCEHFEKSTLLQRKFENSLELPLLRIYSKTILQRGIKNIPDNLRRRSNIEWVKGKHGYPAVSSIHSYGIVIATLCTVGKLVCADVSVNGHFTHVIIDEAGSSSETESLVGIIGIKQGNDKMDCRIILCGDQKQLGPVIKSRKAKNLGLGKSLMERLLEGECYKPNNNFGDYNHNFQMHLRRNYRSHPEIVRLFNHLYYNDELIAMNVDHVNNQRKWSFLPNSNFPIAFHAVKGLIMNEETTSSCNMDEIEVVLSYIWQLIVVDKVDQNDIGVITPYKLQREHIKSYLQEKDLKKIEVGAVENFQGREKTVIIASMVRSNKRLGFVNCPRRLNVLLSRSKSMLIIVGDPDTLCDFGDLKFVINECKAKGNYLDRENETFKIDKNKSKFDENKFKVNILRKNKEKGSSKIMKHTKAVPSSNKALKESNVIKPCSSNKLNRNKNTKKAKKKK